MKAREGDRRPCVYCKTPTVFVFEERGKRGAHIRWIDCCCFCGESPAKRVKAAA